MYERVNKDWNLEKTNDTWDKERNPERFVSIEDMIGKTFVKVYGLKYAGYDMSSRKRIYEETQDIKGVAEIWFFTENEGAFCFYHSQDCCESVGVEDFEGDLSDLVGTPLLKAEEVVSNENPPDYVPDEDGQDSFTWTFYKFATIKGYVDIRWYGESNGYYSEAVSLKWHPYKEVPNQDDLI